LVGRHQLARRDVDTPRARRGFVAHDVERIRHGCRFLHGGVGGAVFDPARGSEALRRNVSLTFSGTCAIARVEANSASRLSKTFMLCSLVLRICRGMYGESRSLWVSLR